MTWSITAPAEPPRYSRIPPASLETRAMTSTGPRRNSTLQMNSSMTAGPPPSRRPEKAPLYRVLEKAETSGRGGAVRAIGSPAHAGVSLSPRFGTSGPGVGTVGSTVRIEVRVELKPGVMDAEAESIETSLGLLGIPSVRHVTTARIYDLEFADVPAAEARRLADRAVEQLLANPVIHRVTVRPLAD